MIVTITNVTDASGGKNQPTQVDIYNKTLDPGASMRIPAELIDKRVRALANEGLIAIGSLPSWYTAAKTRSGKKLTDEEKRNLTVRKPEAPPAPAPSPKKEKPTAPKPEAEQSKAVPVEIQDQPTELNRNLR